MATLAEMYVQGVRPGSSRQSRRSCAVYLLGPVDNGYQQAPGHEPEGVAERPLQEPFAYLVLDARYERVREAGIVMNQAVLIAVGIDWEGRR